MRALGAGFALFAFFASTPAWCDPTLDARAQALFERGLEQSAAGQWAAACRTLEESARLRPTPGASLNLGVCSEEQGLYRLAAQHYRDALLLAPDWSKATEALARVPRLTVVVHPPVEQVIVEVDGETVAVEPQILDRGPHRINVRAPGFEEHSVSVEVTDVSSRLELTLRPAPPPTQVVATNESSEPDSPTARTPIQPAPQGPPGHERTEWDGVGYAALIAGAAGLAAGATLGFFVLDRVDASEPHCRLPGGTCDADGVRLREEASDLQLAGVLAAGVGLASAGAGAWILLSRGQSDPPGAVLFVGGRF